MDRPRVRFRLRTLMFAILVLCVPLAYVASVHQRSREFARTAARLRGSGVGLAHVTTRGPIGMLGGPLNERSHEFFGRRFENQVLTWGTQATPAQLAEAHRGGPFRQVTLGGASNLGDDWVESIRDPSMLTLLHLDATAVSDRCIDSILGMEALNELGLVDTAISDEAVGRLLTHPSLGTLFVGGPNIASVRLIEGEVVNAEGQGEGAATATGVLVVQGRVRAEGFAARPGNIRVMVYPANSYEPTAAVPYGWNAPFGDVGFLEPIGDGVWNFRIPVGRPPPGELRIAIWIDARQSKMQIHCLAGTFNAMPLPPSAGSIVDDGPE